MGIIYLSGGIYFRYIIYFIYIYIMLKTEKMFVIHPSCNTDRGVFCMCEYIILIVKIIYKMKVNACGISFCFHYYETVEDTITRINNSIDYEVEYIQ